MEICYKHDGKKMFLKFLLFQLTRGAHSQMLNKFTTVLSVSITHSRQAL